MNSGYQINFKKRKNYKIKFENTKILTFKNKKFTFFIDGYVINDKNQECNLVKVFKNIYNFEKIKKFLQLHRGAFSLICFSKNNRDIIIARDFDGSNPLYYRNTKSELIISNRPKKLFLSSQSLNHNFLNQYIGYRYNFIYGGKETFIDKINFLEAGTILYFKNFKKHRKEIFCNLPLKSFVNKNSYDQSKIDTLNILKRTFLKDRSSYKDSIIGLSGGLDSTTVAAILGSNGLKLDAFTVYYDTSKTSNLNELDAAKLVAKKYCRKWFKVKINSTDFLNYWKKAYDIFDFPVCTSSFLGYLISYDKIKKLGYKKTINAGNSDLFFHGNYPCYLYHLLDLYEKKDKKFEHELNCWIKNHSTKDFPKSKNTFFKFRENVKFKLSKEGIYKIKPTYQNLDTNYFRKNNQKFTQPKYNNYFNGKSYLDAYTKFAIWIGDKQPNILPFYELEKYTSINSIDPFLRENLKCYFYNLPDEFKIKDGIGKKILRDALKNILPNKIISNINKTGFNLPFVNWIYENKVLKEFVIQTLLQFDNNCNKKKFKISFKVNIKKIIIDIKQEKLKEPDIGMIIWQITNLQLWYDKNF